MSEQPTEEELAVPPDLMELAVELEIQGKTPEDLKEWDEARQS